MNNQNIYMSKLGQTIRSDDLYSYLELNLNNYSRWCKTNIVKNTYAEEGLEYSSHKRIGSLNGGKPTQHYDLHLNFAKKLAMSCKSKKGEEIRDWLVSLTTAVEDKELLTHDEAVMCVKFIEYFKYVENQKIYEKRALAVLAEQSGIETSKKYGMAQRMRNKDLDFSKAQIEGEYLAYCKEKGLQCYKGLNKRKMLIYLDKYRLFRIALYDFCKEKNMPEPKNLAKVIISIASKLGIEIMENQDNLFHMKRALEIPDNEILGLGYSRA